MEHNTYGLDGSAPVVNVNELYELWDQLDEIWNEKFGELEEMEEFEPVKYARLHGELEGIKSAMKAVSDLTQKAIGRMPREQA